MLSSMSTWTPFHQAFHHRLEIEGSAGERYAQSLPLTIEIDRLCQNKTRNRYRSDVSSNSSWWIAVGKQSPHGLTHVMQIIQSRRNCKIGDWT